MKVSPENQSDIENTKIKDLEKKMVILTVLHSTRKW